MISSILAKKKEIKEADVAKGVNVLIKQIANNQRC